MSIKDIIQKININLDSKRGQEIYIISIIILVGLASFGLGRISKIEGTKEPIKIFNKNTENQAGVLNSDLEKNNLREGSTQGNYVASKNGTKYHLPWCSGATTIKEENKIWFNSKEEAEKAGYTPASNCKGI